MTPFLAILVGVCLLQVAHAIDQGCSVTLFDGGSLTGTSATFVLGDYSKTAMIAGGFPDNSVSSLRVSGTRCVATIYDGENLEPASWNSNYPEGEYPLALLQLRGGYDNQASSLKVWRSGCVVTLFDGANFEFSSWSISLMVAPYTLADITSLSGGSGDNVVSSVRVAGPRCKAMTYDGNNFNGAWVAVLPEGDYTSSKFVARGGVDNQLSSIKVELADCVATIYDGSNLENTGWHTAFITGDYTGTQIDTYGDGTGINLASSIRVSGYGCSATAYQTNNLDAGGGWSATFTEGDYPLAQYTAAGAVDNQLQSLKVAYTDSVYSFATDTFSGATGANSIATFFPASIGEQWAWASSGLTLSAGTGSHEKAILRSVAFTLQANTRITIGTGAGGTGSYLLNSVVGHGAVVEYAGTVDGNGYLGFGINDVSLNSYLVSTRRSAASTASEDVVFSTSDLALYANRKVTVDVIDAYMGTVGYLSISSVNIAVACTAIPTVDSCQFDVSQCAQVMPGAACLVYCQGPYTGTASAASCPAGNTDASTPLTFAGFPNCILPCPNPNPLPVGYDGVVGAEPIACDTAGGYVGVATKTCTMDSATCTRQVQISGCGLPNTAAVSGDPITYYGTKRNEFKVPVGGELTTLLEVPDMRVLASAVKGRTDDEQWLDRIIVMTPAGQEVVSVSIKNDLFDFNRSLVPSNAFETINVNMDWWFSMPLTIMPPANEYFIHWNGLRVAFGRARGGALTDAPRREMVMVVSQFANVYIASSSANEFYEQPYYAYKYAHLDLIVGDMRNRSSFAGLLPELWGFAPPSMSLGGRFSVGELHQ